MNVAEFYAEMEKRYPKSLSCPWDNDGIMVSGGDAVNIERVLVALDATEEAVQYAAENGFDLILTHHPIIFSKLSSVTADDNVGRKVIFSLMNNISIMSFHTRLDAGENGVNDALAAALGLADVSSFGDEESPSIGRIGSLGAPVSLARFAAYVKEALQSDCVALAADDAEDEVRRVALVGGAGKDYIAAAQKAGADVYLTGEASYNALLDAAERGMPVVTAGHFFTENPVCRVLAEAARSLCGAYTEIFNSNKVKACGESF